MAEINFVRSDTAPVILIEGAPNFGIFEGLADICLIATRIVPTSDGKTSRECRVVANIRCTAEGAKALRAAIDGVLLMLEPAANESGPAN